MHAVKDEKPHNLTPLNKHMPAEADFGGETGAFYPDFGHFPSDELEKEGVEVFFGGGYNENWSGDYSLTIDYYGRRGVRAVFREGRWHAEDGDGELLKLLESPECPKLTMQYFQAAASAAAAVKQCRERGVSPERTDEYTAYSRNPVAAAELMRTLMDDCGLKLYDAYDTAARCCVIDTQDIDRKFLYTLQPRTYHVLHILDDCCWHVPALQHDSRKSEYRSPSGALPCGSRIRLAFRVLGGRPLSASLMLSSDSSREEYPMERQGNMYSVTLRLPDEPAAMWYSFKIETEEGTRWLCPDACGYLGGVYESEYSLFRLTVYKKDFETPDWFRGASMYQIFPDRFAFSRDGTAERGIEYHRSLGQTPELHKSPDEPVRYKARPFEKNYRPDDFYGGTFRGIEKRLDYIKSLGTDVIYLNPIFEASSNHRYDTADYMKADPVLGSNEDFRSLCRKAEKLGMRIMLDGVFSHTGADSRYFNRWGRYPQKGACQGTESEYYSWYDFRHFPDDYRCWWGFKDLPEVEERNPGWQDYVITGHDSVVKTWLRRGAAGWRLDVADELPDDALALIRTAAKEEKPDAVVLGEVWEDAVLKQSYGGRRNYALGYSLDSVMNYPFRSAVTDFIHGHINACGLRDFLISQQMNYPKPMYYCLMNLLGSHDVVRIRTAAAADVNFRSLSREQQLELEISDEALDEALEKEKICAAVQYAVPGVPSLYYGDEQGMCGVSDPFNRQCFRESDCGLYEWYRGLGAFRRANPAMRTGAAAFIACSADVLLILRWNEKGRDAFGNEKGENVCLCAVNRGEHAEDFVCDLGCAGLGAYRGSIAARSAEYIRLK